MPVDRQCVCGDWVEVTHGDAACACCGEVCDGPLQYKPWVPWWERALRWLKRDRRVG